MEYKHTGSVQTFTAPVDGVYKLEVWGAQGGDGWGLPGGKGSRDLLLCIASGGVVDQMPAKSQNVNHVR